MGLFKDLPVLSFESQAEWREWLDGHHSESQGLWLRIFKKGSARATVTYAEALDEALCFGWIDSAKARYDDQSFLQRFSPRRARSIWSKINQEHVARLIGSGKMHPEGQRAIEESKRNGAWDLSYDSQSRAAIPQDFQALLDRTPAAREFFESLDAANRYAFLFRIQTSKKPETRARKLKWALEKLENGEKLH